MRPPQSNFRQISFVLGCFSLVCTSFGCKERAKPTEPAAQAAASGAKASTSASAKPSAKAASNAVVPPRNFFVPTGPRYPILPGQGIGPIRLGATPATIERLMALPCDYQTPSVCRYYARAVEFELEDGVTRSMVVYRRERPAGTDAKGKPHIYGTFNGAILPDLMPGMLPEAIIEHLGTPKRVEKLKRTRLNAPEERHYYDGLVLEYDRLENGNLALGSIRVVPADNPAKTEPASKAKSAPTAKAVPGAARSKPTAPH